MNTIPSAPEPRALGKRALVAIMFTDVVDSSKLMGDNEEQAMKLLKRDLTVIAELCQQFEGRVLKSMGDGCLAIFDSGVHAVQCAQEIQRQFAEQATSLPSTEILQHRIGLHLGDIYITDNDVMGDGVNVAARVQTEAPPGGICLSQALYEVVKSRLALQTVYQGPKQLKNIKEAVHLYQITAPGEIPPQASPSAEPEKVQPTSTPKKKAPWKLIFWIAGIVFVLLFLGSLRRQAARKKAAEEASPTSIVTQETAEPNDTRLLDQLQGFKRLDQNKDQRLTREELPERLRAPIMRADSNQDGSVSEDELKDYVTQQISARQLFQRYDLNHNKQLSKEEIPDVLRERILKADKNGDGVVTEAEVKDALK